MRPVLYAVLAVFGLLALSIAVNILANVPTGLRLAAITAMAESCMPPERFPGNAGKRVDVELRQEGSGTDFTATPIDTWVGDTSAKLRSETDPARDLVVYVHGFHTGMRDATCMGDVLRAELAGLPAYSAGEGPDILVIGWPGEFSAWKFTSAQDNATGAGRYLTGVLQALNERRVILIAHSLGAGVAMTALDGLTEGSAPPLAGLLLIQGAIPAVSIRNWRLTLHVTFPAAELDDIRAGKPLRSPIEETASGRGSFVTAAAKAEHFVVTIAGADIPLKNAFALSETFIPFDKNRPLIPPQIGEMIGDAVEVGAIGSPFPTGKIYRTYDQVMPGPVNQFDPHRREIGANIPSLKQPDDSRVMSRSKWVFEFDVPHRSYHELRLDEGQWWRLLHDWHGVMTNAEARHRILSESWAIFTATPN